MSESRARFFVEGTVAGFIGYGVVAALFALLNLVQGRSIFYTAALLGSDLFYGLESPADLVIGPGPVLAYNGVHLVGFLLVGVFMGWLVGLAERIPQGWYLILILFLVVMAHVFGLPIWFQGPVVAEISLWYVVFATSLAALAMGAFFYALHPRLRDSMRAYSDEWNGEEADNAR